RPFGPDSPALLALPEIHLTPTLTSHRYRPHTETRLPVNAVALAPSAQPRVRTILPLQGAPDSAPVLGRHHTRPTFTTETERRAAMGAQWKAKHKAEAANAKGRIFT